MSMWEMELRVFFLAYNLYSRCKNSILTILRNTAIITVVLSKSEGVC